MEPTIDSDNKKLVCIEEIEDPMTPNHFKAAVKTMKLSSDDVVQASYLVLCKGVSVQDATTTCNVKHPSQVSRAVAAVKAKWREIYEENGLVCEMVALTPKQMQLVRECIEINNIEPLLKKSSGWEKYNLDDFEEVIKNSDL